MLFSHRLNQVKRPGIKEELTTRDEYLGKRFLRLSNSGHDLTPLLESEKTPLKLSSQIDNIQEYYSKLSGYGSYLGQGSKGIYVCAIGGLPLFSSGSRINDACNKTTLIFDEPCDHDHISIRKEISPIGEYDLNVYCVRSEINVGKYISDKQHSVQGHYFIDSKNIIFLPVDVPWPPESQPENFWGTEGQYCAWNNHERIRNPLSYQTSSSSLIDFNIIIVRILFNILIQKSNGICQSYVQQTSFAFANQERFDKF